MLKAASTFILFFFLFAYSADGAEAKRTPPFTDPKCNFSAFVERIATGNIDDALELFCYKETAAHFDLVKMPATLRNAVFPKQTILNTYGEYSIFNETYAKARAADSVLLFVYALLLHPDYDSLGLSPVFNDGDDVGTIESTMSGIVDALDPSRLAGLTFVEMDEIPQNNPDMAKMALGLKEAYGYDERKEYSILFRLGDVHFAGFVSMVRYGEHWHIEYLYNYFTGNDAPLAATTPEKYEEYKKGF